MRVLEEIAGDCRRYSNASLAYEYCTMAVRPVLLGPSATSNACAGPLLLPDSLGAVAEHVCPLLLLVSLYFLWEYERLSFAPGHVPTRNTMTLAHINNEDILRSVQTKTSRASSIWNSSCPFLAFNMSSAAGCPPRPMQCRRRGQGQRRPIQRIKKRPGQLTTRERVGGEGTWGGGCRRCHLPSSGAGTTA